MKIQGWISRKTIIAVVGGFILTSAAIAAGRQWNKGASASSSGDTTARAEVPYAPSAFPGVMVRNVPEQASEVSSHAGWVYREPGAPMPPASTVRRSMARTKLGTTRAGGVMLEPDESYFARETARVTSGGVTVSCEKNR